MNQQRVYVAFLVSPLMALLTFTVTTLYVGLPFGELTMALMFYGPLAYVVAAVLGIPLFLLYRRWRWENVAAYILGGTVIGSIVALPLIRFLSWGTEQALSMLLLWTSAGALSALLFWLIVFGFTRHSSSFSPSTR